MDWSFDDTPVLYVFPQGMTKTGASGDSNSATWTSKYGSVMVSSFGDHYIAADGVNTAGLSMHGLWLVATKFPSRDTTKPGVLEGRYGEFLLDEAATVTDALALFSQYQVVPQSLYGQALAIHVALEDSTGDSAVVEFVNGQMNIYHGASYNTTVLTNDPTFDLQLENLLNYQYFQKGGSLALPGDIDPQSRFVRASAFLSTLPAPTSIGEAVSSLFGAIRGETTAPGAGWFTNSTFTQASPTQWTSLYDLTNKVVYFQHMYPSNNFYINMSNLNFSSGAQEMYLNAEQPGLSGEVSSLFTPVTQGNFYETAIDLGGGLKWLSWFGKFTPHSNGWLYHQQLGWLWTDATAQNSSIWFYDPQWNGRGGLWWTNSLSSPWLFSLSENKWLEFDAADSTPQSRKFYNTSGQIETH
jgi:choloylglycine hydrolase